MRLVLAKLLWAFGLEWEEGEGVGGRGTVWVGWESQRTYALWLLWNKRVLRVRIREREGVR